MYRSKLWTMRMFAGFGTAEDTNARFHELLRAGGTGLSTAFDMPTLMGRDSDHEWSAGKVGRAGVAVDTLADMADLFAEIDLGLAVCRSPYREGGIPIAELDGSTRAVRVSLEEGVAEPLDWPYPDVPYPDLSLYLDDSGHRDHAVGPTPGIGSGGG